MKTTISDLARLIPILVAFVSTSAPAQSSWTNRFNGPGNSGDYINGMVVDASGNVFVTGYAVWSGSVQNFGTLKYSNSGVPLWTNRYSHQGLGDVAWAIALDRSSNIVVTGSSTTSGAGADFATIKYSNSGVALWTNRYNGPANGFDDAYAIAVDVNGNVFITGRSPGSGSGDDYATIKYSSGGVPQWTNRFNGSGNGQDIARSIAVDTNGNAVVTGQSMGSGTGLDYVTIKYSASGTPMWTNRYNGDGNADDAAQAVGVDKDGNIIVTGYSSGVGSGADWATIKYSESGVPLWTNRYSGSGNSADYCYALAIEGSGSLVVAGSSVETGTGSDCTTIKYSADGTGVWTNKYNGPGNGSDSASDVAIDGYGNVFVTGTAYINFNVSGGNYDYVTLAYSGGGLALRTNLYGGPGFSFDGASGIAVDAGNNVFVSGYSQTSSSNLSADYATIKYSAVNPQTPIILGGPQINGADFGFTLSAEPGGVFAVQVSTNIIDWETVQEVVVPVGGNTNITVSLELGVGQKFYRTQRQ